MGRPIDRPIMSYHVLRTVGSTEHEQMRHHGTAEERTQDHDVWRTPHGTSPMIVDLGEDGVYNLTRPIKTLRIEINTESRRWLPRSPMMAAGLTDHIWSIREMLCLFQFLPTLFRETTPQASSEVIEPLMEN